MNCNEWTSNIWRLSFREGPNDLNISDPFHEAIFPPSINEASAVVLYLISDTTWLRAFGQSPEKKSKNKVRETWFVKKPWTEGVQPIKMKTAKGHGDSLPLLKILVQKSTEICPPWTQRVEKLIIGFSYRKVESGWILGKGQFFWVWLWEGIKTITWWGVKGRLERNRNSLSYFGDALEEFTNPLTLFSPNYTFHFPSQ